MAFFPGDRVDRSVRSGPPAPLPRRYTETVERRTYGVVFTFTEVDEYRRYDFRRVISAEMVWTVGVDAMQAILRGEYAARKDRP